MVWIAGILGPVGMDSSWFRGDESHAQELRHYQTGTSILKDGSAI